MGTDSRLLQEHSPDSGFETYVDDAFRIFPGETMLSPDMRQSYDLSSTLNYIFTSDRRIETNRACSRA